MLWFIAFGLRRLGARWRSLLTLIIGVFLAALIGANASLYTTAISQLGLVQFLSSQAPSDTNIFARVSITPSDVDNFADEWAIFDANVAQEAEGAFADLERWSGEVLSYAESQTLIPVQAGTDLPNTRVRLSYYEYLEAQVELLEGELPQLPSNPDIQAEVLLNAEVAALLGLSVGDILELDQRGRDSNRIISVQISGFVRPLNEDAPFWFDPSPLRFSTPSNQLEPNLLTTRQTIEDILPEFLPEISIQVGWRIAASHSQLPFTQINTAAMQVEAFSVGLNERFLAEEGSNNSYVYATNLPTLLRDYEEQIVFLNIPFGLLMWQLSALVLFFLMLIAALVRRGERREVALLQSRGATDGQIIAARSIEALIICILATLVAPFVARFLLEWFVPLLTGIQEIPLELNLQVFLFAGFASSVAFITLMLTLYPVLRKPLVSAGGAGSRSQSQTWWQRYYLDVILLIIAIIALYQLTQSRTVIADTGTQSTQVDYLLLITPTFLFVAMSSVILRFFPLAMSWVAGFFASRSGMEGALATWQVSREPLHYGRITFLLSLAIGIGWFAVSYQATLLGNQVDQASYLVGSDVRIVYDASDSSAIGTSMRRISQLEDVQASAEVTRIELPSVVAVTGTGRPTRQAGDLLLVDMESLQEVVSWRDNLGDLNLPDTPYSVPDEIGITLPENTERIGFWVQLQSNANLQFIQYTDEISPYPAGLLQDNLFTIRVQDASGRAIPVPMVADAEPVEARIEELSSDLEEGQFLWQPQDTDGDEILDFIPRYEWENDGWVYFESDIAFIDNANRLFALDVWITPNNFYSLVELSIGALQFIDAEGNILTNHYTTSDIEILEALNSTSPEEIEVIPSPDSRFGDFVLQANWFTENTFDAPNSLFALMFNYPELTSVSTDARSVATTTEEELAIVGMPVLISRSLADINDLTLDQRFNLVVNNVSPWFSVSRIVDYYPTLFQDRPYIIVDAHLFNYTMSRAVNQPIVPNELWLDLAPNADASEFLFDLRLSDDARLFAEIVSLEDSLSAYESDVLSLGVIGLLFISFIIGVALSVVSLVTYISLTVKSRLGEFAVLRALGLTTTRMIISILLEQGLVLISAIVLGAILGQYLTLQILEPLALSAAGGMVTPPFTLIVDYIAIAQYLLIILLVLGVVLLITAYTVRWTATADALRLTEE